MPNSTRYRSEQAGEVMVLMACGIFLGFLIAAISSDIRDWRCETADDEYVKCLVTTQDKQTCGELIPSYCTDKRRRFH
jgi:hypothetical protein